MFVLDTNILSAMMRLDRTPEVAAWMAGQDEYPLVHDRHIARGDLCWSGDHDQQPPPSHP